MKNPFNASRAYNEKVKRNNFDLSFQNHLTMKFGNLYPVFCKEVVPGDSFKIDTAFGLKFMPLVFPVQSKMRAHMHFFYCRNKNLWKNWENWLMNLKDYTHPYIDKPVDFFKTGSLADYMDIPTTLISSVPQNVAFNFGDNANSVNVSTVTTQLQTNRFLEPVWLDNFSTASIFQFMRNFNPTAQYHTLGFPVPVPFPASSETFTFQLTCSPVSEHFVNGSIIGAIFTAGTENDILQSRIVHTAVQYDVASITGYDNVFELTTQDLTSDDIVELNSIIERGEKLFVTFIVGTKVTDFPYVTELLYPNVYGYDKADPCIFTGVSFDALVNLPIDLSDTANNPYNKTDGIRLNALPFRAYESIYRAFYANSVLQPLVVNGEIEYNKYVSKLRRKR